MSRMSNFSLGPDGAGGAPQGVFSEIVWLSLIVGSTAGVVFLTIYCLLQGITTIFVHVYYFPVILLAYHYRYRGFVLATFVSFVYVGLVYLYDAGQADVITGAWLRFFAFVGVAAVVAYLSDYRYEDQIALHDNERKLRRLFEAMLEGFAYCRMIYDTEGRPVDWIYLEVNAAFERLTGLKNISGKRVLEAIPDIRSLTPELFDTYGRVASTGVPELFEIDFKPLKKWLKVSVFSPEKGYFVAVFEDITEPKQAEEALRESEKRYRDMFELNNAVMIIINPGTGRIVDANSAAIRYYGYSREEFPGLAITDINIDAPDITKKNMSQAAENHGAVFNFRHRKKSGEIRDVEVFSAPISLGGERFLHSIVQDVTERRQAEEALRKANSKMNLLSGITRHDIRNQLFALKAYLELSKNTLGDAAITSEYIIKEERAANAIERQIAFTKEYEDLGVKSPAWESVEACIRKALDVLPMRDIQVISEADDLEVYADPLFERVFYNLIDNALRYGGQNMTRIRIASQESESGLLISVEDDGAGISDEDRKRLFERGFGHNTGLGLFLSREILAITGITITENGAPGKGARFGITVPKGGYRNGGAAGTG
jgi:PAS domain S-box-containing protein